MPFFRCEETDALCTIGCLRQIYEISFCNFRNVTRKYFRLFRGFVALVILHAAASIDKGSHHPNMCIFVWECMSLRSGGREAFSLLSLLSRRRRALSVAKVS